MPRAAGSNEVEGLDEEFLYHLSRGSELLARGEAEAARASLLRAFHLFPRDSKMLGLLGQACYRLGRFEEAIDIYGKLVDENPVESAARVNLGLACLKARRHGEAVKQLSIALDLNPGHKKAMGYLGLAYFESGDPRAAREWFARSGSTVMVARCDEAMAGGPLRVTAADAALPESPEPLRASLPGDLEPVRMPAVSYPGLASYATARVVTPPGEVFASTGGTLTMWVHGELLTRLEGLYAVRGNLKATPARKRFRGRATERPFGEGPHGMHRVTGEGSLFFRAEGRRHLALDLGGDAGYFREEAVFAMEESVVFENGRVQSKGAPDLELVHLRGKGRFLLVTEGEPVAVEVSSAAPLRVPQRVLVGWVGGLTPRLVGFADAPAAADAGDSGAGAPAMVELNGEGRALVDPAAGRGAV